jgi:hypothetical protein
MSGLLVSPVLPVVTVCSLQTGAGDQHTIMIFNLLINTPSVRRQRVRT